VYRPKHEYVDADYAGDPVCIFVTTTAAAQE